MSSRKYTIFYKKGNKKINLGEIARAWYKYNPEDPGALLIPEKGYHIFFPGHFYCPERKRSFSVTTLEKFEIIAKLN